jgi:hypothetical protein
MKVTSKTNLQVQIDIYNRESGLLENMSEQFDLTFTPYGHNSNGREVSKKEDFIGYKDNFVFRFFKENSVLEPKRLTIDGSHISSPNILPVVTCDDSEIEVTTAEKMTIQNLEYPYDGSINPSETVFLNSKYAAVFHKDIENGDLILNVMFMKLNTEATSMKIMADSSLGGYELIKVLSFEDENL